MDGTDRTAARNAFFDRLAGNWSQTHYGPAGGMVPRIARFAEALKSFVPAPAKILDYGCGTGDIAAALATKGYDVVGRDVSASMIAKARAIHGASGAQFSVIDPSRAQADVNLGGEIFDAIVCSSVLEYVEDLPGSLNSLAAALKPGGWLLATVPNILHPVRHGESWHRLLMSNPMMRSLIRFTPKRESYELQWLSRNRFPISQWAVRFQAAGLQPVWQDCEDHPLTLMMGRRQS
jgi:2-polyprenyl-3-methyl-5-hydroxy-6-metoxy-1,4-benzoquinol methylase